MLNCYNTNHSYIKHLAKYLLLSTFRVMISILIDIKIQELIEQEICLQKKDRFSPLLSPSFVKMLRIFNMASSSTPTKMERIVLVPVVYGDEKTSTR